MNRFSGYGVRFLSAMSSSSKLTFDVVLERENGLSFAISFILGALLGGGGDDTFGQPKITLPSFQCFSKYVDSNYYI